jgi:manganese/zinc/iron transport system permease protein
MTQAQIEIQLIAVITVVACALPGVLLVLQRNAVSGYWLARALDASIAGAMASMAGVIFVIALLFAPRRGLVAAARMRRAQRQEFAFTMLTAYLLIHEQSRDAEIENSFAHLGNHLRWQPDFATHVVKQALR